MGPQFSIVIPTHDRPGLVGGAVRSALGQYHGDFEVLVCDNSSDDRTREVLKGFNDPKLRVVRPSRVLPMHENWAFALSHARGQWVTYLCDDDAATRGMLSHLDVMIERTGADVLSWRMAFYGYSDVFDPAQRDRFRLGVYTDRAYEIDGEALIDAAYDMRVTLNDVVPRMLNTAVSRDVLNRAQEERISLFRPSCPDYSSMLALAICAEHPVFLDVPLSIGGLSTQSIGTSSLNGGAAAQRFIEQVISTTPELRLLPCMAGTRSWIAQTYLQCAQEIEVLRGRTPNLAHTYGLVLRELRGLGVGSEDVERILATLSETEQGIAAEIGTGRLSIETDGFIRPLDNCGEVYGSGPFIATGGLASEQGFGNIVDLACGLESWIGSNAVAVSTMWDRLHDIAGARSVVVYGLGHQGRALVRVPPEAGHPLQGRVLCHDDGVRETPAGFAPLASPDDLALRDHVVLVTPLQRESIGRRLGEHGFERGRDWFGLDDVVQWADAAASSSAVMSASQT